MSTNKEKIAEAKTPAEEAKPVEEIERIEVRPAVDIIEGEEGVCIFFEVPGANAKSVDVEVNDGVLYMSAKSTITRNGRPVLFKRAFQISDAVDVANISAKTADGVLEITLPKSERAKIHKVKVN